MLWEKRVYTVAPGRMADLHERFRSHTVGLFDRHGITPVGFFVNEIGGASDQLIYFLSFESHAQREESWRNFLSDPEWQKVKAASEESGPLVVRIDNSLLKAVDYSSAS
jgi:hypothetical protein